MPTDNILLLPVDILVYIFMTLRPCDLRNLMLTCRFLYDFIKNDTRIWRSISHDFIIIQDDVDSSRSYQSWYNRCRRAHNWHCGCYKNKSIVRHCTNYMPWLTYHDSEHLLYTVGSEIFCCRSDSKGIPNCSKHLWKINVPTILRQDVRTNDISRFVFKNKVLVCGNRDGCVAVYKVNSTTKRPKLMCHIKDCHNDGQAEVSAVEVFESRDQLSVVSCSSHSRDLLLSTMSAENDIFPISNDELNVKNVQISNGTGAKCLAMNEMVNQLAVGMNGNSRPLLLDVNNAHFLMTAEKSVHPRQVIRDIQWHDHNTLVYVTHSGFLELLDARSHEVAFRVRDPFQSSLYCVKTDGDNGIMVGSAEYSRCVLFDARTNAHHIQMYFTQRNTSPVYCLAFDSNKLISAVDRGISALSFNIDYSATKQRDYSRHVFK